MNVLPKLIQKEMWLNSINLNIMTSFDKNVVKTVIFTISGSVYTEQKGAEVEVVNQFSEDLKADDTFFNDFKIIKTGTVARGSYLGLSIMNFELICSSDTSGT